MAILRTTIPDIFIDLLANLEEVLYQNWDLFPSKIETIFRMPATPNAAFVHTTGVSDLGQFVEKGEDESVTYDTVAQLFEKKFTFLTWAKGVKFSREAADDQKFDLVAQVGQSLARGGAITRETNHANVFNRAFNSSYTGPDGVELCSDSHTLGKGGTGDNKLATSALGATALELALNLFQDQVTDAGNKINLPYKQLLVPGELQWQGAQLLNSTLLPGTMNNDINPLKGLLDLEIWHYLTDAAAWFVLADKSVHNVRSYYREPFNVDHGPDFDTRGTKTLAAFREITGWSMWQGVIGVPSS